MLRIYSKQATNFNNNGLAILQNAYDVKIHEVINGEYTLDFALPQYDSKLAYIEPLNFVTCECQLFRIKKIDETTTKVNVHCEHVFYDLIDCKYIPNYELIGQTPAQILTELLSDTPFTLSVCEITTPTDMIISKVNPTEVIAKLIEQVGGELEKNNYNISLVVKRGNITDIKFKLDRNITDLKRETDASNVVTRIYPYGEDDLDISTVNGGLHYIDSPLISNYSYPKTAYVDYKDIKDPTALKNKALENWSTLTKDGVDKPKISYSCGIVELKKLGLTDYNFAVGDTITIEDETLNIDTVQRIVDYTYYPYEAKRSSVTLINYSALDYITLKSVFSDINKTKETLNKLIAADGNIVAQYVSNIQQKLSTEVNQIAQKALLHNTPDIYVDNVSNPTKAMLIGAGVFAVANSKTQLGDWNWRTIGTGDRFIADEVDAAWVYAGGISADQITTGKLTSGQIDATNLHVNSANIDGTIVADSVASNWIYAGSISANQITAGSISANRISGGTLSGVSLNIDTDAVVGNNLTLGSMYSDTTKAIYFYNSSGGTAKIGYSSGGYLSLNAWGSVRVTSPGGFICNKLEVTSATATVNGDQIATISEVQDLIDAAIASHVETFHF